MQEQREWQLKTLKSAQYNKKKKRFKNCQTYRPHFSDEHIIQFHVKEAILR